MNRRAGKPITKKVTQLLNVEEHVEGFRQVREAHRRELIDDYVELISDLINEVGEARQVDMAARLGVSQPTVAKMLKRLASVGLIEQIPWRGIFLTPEGEKLAQESRERHQIVENFLLAIGVSAEIARRDAEGMEHHVSEETLAMFLKFTQTQDLRKHDSSLRPVAAARSFSPFAADYRLRAQRHRAVCPGKLAGGH